MAEMGVRKLAGRRGAVALALCALALIGGWACGEGREQPAPATAAPPSVIAARPTVPGVGQQVTLQGTLTLDGVPLETDFLGARVVRDGLTAACQNEIPAVAQGRYEITVAADAEVRGCGVPGAELLLWAFVGDTFVFSADTLPWPGDGATTTFDAGFSAAAPEGASLPATELKGLLFERDGGRLPAGTVVEAYAGDTLCGVTSLRHGGVTEGYYTLIVAGPDAVAGCDEGATLTFRLDGQPATETAINDLRRDDGGHELNLSLR